MIQQNMSFAMGNFKGNGKVNGQMVLVHQLPLTKGGVMGTIDTVNAPAKFGRAVSIDPDYPDTFLVGHPAGSVLKGFLVFDPAIARNDPGMRDEYFEGRPATCATYGMVQFSEYDPAGSTPKEGMHVGINKTTGQIVFDDDAITATGYEEIDAFVYETDGPNGVTVFIKAPFVTQTPEPQPDTATPVFSPAAGAVTSGALVALACATPGAKIYYTVDGSTPDNTDTLYDPTAKIEVTATVTIKAIAYADYHEKSSVASATYTVA